MKSTLFMPQGISSRQLKVLHSTSSRSFHCNTNTTYLLRIQPCCNYYTKNIRSHICPPCLQPVTHVYTDMSQRIRVTYFHLVWMLKRPQQLLKTRPAGGSTYQLHEVFQFTDLLGQRDELVVGCKEHLQVAQPTQHGRNVTQLVATKTARLQRNQHTNRAHRKPHSITSISVA